MGRAPCCDKTKVKRGAWSPEEDAALRAYLHAHSGVPGNWISLPSKAGLKRCGKSCRLRWLNYLRPHLKRGAFTHQEDNLILSLYSKMGSRWSVIAANLPGRTDNDVKNHWHTKLKKQLHSVTARQDQNPNALMPTFTSLLAQAPHSKSNYSSSPVLSTSSPNNYLLIPGTQSQEPRSSPFSTHNCLTYPFHATNVDHVFVLGDTGFPTFLPSDHLLFHDAVFGHS